MITPKLLVRRRIKENAGFQWKALRQAVDWTVALYIVIPALFFAGLQYYTWISSPPDWFAFIPFPLCAFVLFLYVCSGKLRFFLENADQLILLQHPHWIRELRRTGLIYSLTKQFLLTALIMALLAPFLIRIYSVNVPYVVWLGIFTFLSKWNLQLIQKWLDSRYPGLRNLWLHIVWFVISCAVYISVSYWLLPIQPLALLISLVLVLTGQILWRSKVGDLRTIQQDIKSDYEAKMLLAGFILAYSVPARPKSSRKRPFLFRSSNRLFKKRNSVNGLAEAGIKLFFRNRSSVMLYIQLVSVCSFAMLTLPDPMKWVLWLAAAFLLASMVKLAAKETRSGPLLGMFPWKDGVIREAARKSVGLAVIPGFAVISAVMGAALFSWWGALLLLPVGGMFAYWAAGVLTMFEK
ncbi:ABC transporter permease [Paenibacillus sp. 32O-W]|uniref:ABC transporter permease n=1 Tax=Paenibacillus sp. 32O-W TaxID=1695218 RepID=UPI001642CB74|nr:MULTISPECIES: ABC transporter permease [Paenibacillaceae]